jgi:arginine deiminase
MLLNETVALLDLAHNTVDKDQLRSKFLDSYTELEAAYEQQFSIRDVVNAAFKGLDENNNIVTLYRQAA